MQTKKFTAIGVEAFKAKAQRYEVTDGLGLRLFVFPSGVKSWGMRYRPPGSRKAAKIMFGKWPATTLAQARFAVASAKLALAQGTDPAEAKRKQRTEAELADSNTLRAVAEAHLRQEENRPADKRLRTIGQRRATFERLIYPVLGGRPINDIRRGEVVKLLDAVEHERGGRMADEVLSVLNILFRWHAIRHEDFRTPLVQGMQRTKPKDRRRTRVLSSDELRAVWTAACEMKGSFGKLVRFLLLTATRRNEAARMRWDEITGADWVILAERYKNKLDHLVPLSQAARQLLADMAVIAGCPYVFSTDGVHALSDFARFKRALDAASGVAGWRLHDLRRVSRSLLSRAGVNVDVAEKCLGHVPEALRKTYDRHDYHAEKARAFEALAAQIEQIVQPPTGNVVALRP
jgi:integrase